MVEFRFDGLNELISKLDGLGKGQEVEKIERELILEALDKAEKSIKQHFQRSKDNSKSGIRGHHVGGHYVDNIPKSNIKKNSKGMYMTLGEKSENGDYAYARFPNYGTSKQAPNFAYEYAYESAQKSLDEQGIKKFEDLLNNAFK